VPQRAAALLMEAMGTAHLPHPIAQVMVQGTGDAAALIGSWPLAGSAAGSGAHQGLAGPQGRTAWRLGLLSRNLLLAARKGSEGSHRGDGGEEPHHHRLAAAPRQGRPPPWGRLARSLTRREDWPRDAVGVRQSGDDFLPPCCLPTAQDKAPPFSALARECDQLEHPARMPRRCLKPGFQQGI
jgi:hypothetical protein